MAIYLDEQTRPYLERLIKKQIEKSDNDFIAKRIMGALEADWKRLEGIRDCEHVPSEWIGKKTCCLKCQSFYEVGMGESWTNNNPDQLASRHRIVKRKTLTSDDGAGIDTHKRNQHGVS